MDERNGKSLSWLTQKFVELLCQSENGLLDLKEVSSAKK